MGGFMQDDVDSFSARMFRTMKESLDIDSLDLEDEIEVEIEEDPVEEDEEEEEDLDGTTTSSELDTPTREPRPTRRYKQHKLMEVPGRAQRERTPALSSNLG